MIRHLLVFFLVNLVVHCSAQQLIRGVVLNAETRLPVPYANIGILSANVGSISNLDGTFSLPVPVKNLKDSLTISAIGFGKRKVAIPYFMQHEHASVLLREKVTVLEKIVVTASREKPKLFEVGNKKVSGGVLETDTSYAGGSMALLIDNKHQKDVTFPLYIERASLRILRNNLRECKFRVRVNAVDSVSGAPGKDLLEKSVTITSTMRKGWLEFDLSSFQLLINEPFFLTFEQILDVNDRTSIADGYREYLRAHPEKLKIDTVEVGGDKYVRRVLKGGIDLPGTFVAIDDAKSTPHICFERETSFGEWKRTYGIITAFATLNTQTVSPNTEGEVSKNCITAQCKAETRCRNFMEETGTNGLQLVVTKGRQTVVAVSAGFADVDNKVLVTSDKRFRIYSISKSITSAALVKLAHEGLLDLDAPVQQYVGVFPNISLPFSVRQLSGHTAGARDYDESTMTDYVRFKHYRTCTEAMEIVRNDTLLFSPGTRFHYSTFGWIIIGAAMEATTKKDYSSIMTALIFEPLQLTQTSIDDNELLLASRSKFYDAAGNVNAYGDFSYKYAGGGLLSTAQDLARFGNAFLDDKYFDEQMKSTLFTSQRTTAGEATGYGVGWYVGNDKRGRKIWHHSGDSFSGSSHLIIYPEHDLVISFLANAQAGAAFDWEEIADMVME